MKEGFTDLGQLLAEFAPKVQTSGVKTAGFGLTVSGSYFGRWRRGPLLPGRPVALIGEPFGMGNRSK